MVLSLGRLEKFPSSLIENLVRIGNVSCENPNNFWNAIFFGFKSYRELTFQERMSFIQDERGRIADLMSQKEWLMYSDGFHANRHILYVFKENFVNDNKKNIVLKVIPNRTVFLENLNEIEDSSKYFQELERRYEETLVNLEKLEHKQIPIEKKKQCILLFQKYIQDLWKHSSKLAFEEFTDSIRDVNVSIPFYMIPLILKHLSFFVFIMDQDGSTILSLNSYYENIMKESTEKECVLIVGNENGFESLGVMEQNTNDSNTVLITRLFPKNHPITQICYKRIIKI